MAMPFGGTRSIDDYDTGTRAAAAGGTTCIVDFVIQQEPGGLRSSLDEWQERASGAAHVDYGFHMAITSADEGTFADMEPMVEEGLCTFKVFLAYKGVLMVTDDLFFRVLERTRDLNALTMVHCENGWVIDVMVERALAAGQTEPIHHAYTRPEPLEAEATGRAVRFAEMTNAGVYIVHVTCGLAADEIAAGQARGVDGSNTTTSASNPGAIVPLRCRPKRLAIAVEVMSTSSDGVSRPPSIPRSHSFTSRCWIIASPLGIFEKSSRPSAFCSELNGQ